jgi:hypothetical protein
MNGVMVLQAAKTEAIFNETRAESFLNKVLTNVRSYSVNVVSIRVTSFIVIPLAFLVVAATCAEGIARRSRKWGTKSECISTGCVPLMVSGASHGFFLIALVPLLHFFPFISLFILFLYDAPSLPSLPSLPFLPFLHFLKFITLSSHVTHDDSYLFFRCSV